MGGTLRVIAKVLGRLRPYRLAFAGAVLQVLLIGVLELAKPWPLKVVVDNVLGRPSRRHPVAGRPAAARAAARRLRRARRGVRAPRRLQREQQLRDHQRRPAHGERLPQRALRAPARLSLAFHSRREVGDLLYRLTSDTFAIQTLTMNGFFPILTSLVLLVGMVVVMVRLDPLLTLASLAVVPFLFLAITRLSTPHHHARRPTRA